MLFNGGKTQRDSHLKSFVHNLLSLSKSYRMMQFSDPQFAVDAHARHNYAYRQWQRLSAIKDIESRQSRQTFEEAVEDEDKDEED